MRIAFDHQIFGWQEYGGISRYFVEIANQLAQKDKCEVAVISPIYVNRYLDKHKGQFSVKGRRILPRIARNGRLVRAFNRLFAGSLMRSYTPDIVHETYYSTSGVTPKTSKTVVTVYDMIHERFPQFFSPLDPTPREKKAAVRRADHVICISETTRKDLITFTGIDPQKTSTVLLGHSLQTLGENAPHPLGGEPYLLYVGARRGYKNFKTLVNSYAASAELRKHFRLVTFGAGPLNSDEMRAIQREGLDPSRILYRSGNDDSLSAYYRHAACFVFPSLYEGFGIPPLEAMAHGCPVVCGNGGSLLEVVGDAARKVDSTDAEDLRAAMEEVVLSPATRAELVARGRERVKSFSWEKCAADTLSVYEKVLE